MAGYASPKVLNYLGRTAVRSPGLSGRGGGEVDSSPPIGLNDYGVTAGIQLGTLANASGRLSAAFLGVIVIGLLAFSWLTRGYHA